MSFPSDAKLPLLAQLYDAASNQARAEILLRVPDNLVLKYATPILETLRHAAFSEGELFIQQRVAVLMAVRDSAGHLPANLAHDLERMRHAMAAYAAEPPAAVPDEA